MDIGGILEAVILVILAFYSFASYTDSKAQNAKKELERGSEKKKLK